MRITSKEMGYKDGTLGYYAGDVTCVSALLFPLELCRSLFLLFVECSSDMEITHGYTLAQGFGQMRSIY